MILSGVFLTNLSGVLFVKMTVNNTGENFLKILKVIYSWRYVYIVTYNGYGKGTPYLTILDLKRLRF